MQNRKKHPKCLLMLWLVGLSLTTNSALAEPQVNLVLELGAGHFAYLGSEYHFAAWPVVPVENIGVLCGYTYLSEDAVHVVEPAVYVSGSVLENFTWRVKGGKLLVTSYEYHASGQAWTGALDVLWNFTSWTYVELSLPYVAGDQGSAWVPCIGLGMNWPLWKGAKR
jgi:hypothetical protein